MYLVDTNIFLEILLIQEKQKACKKFLEDNIGSLAITDFSLHSIGVILFRNAKEGIFQKFANDIVSNVEVITLQKDLYGELAGAKKKFGLDFDDAYQYKVAQEQELEIVTMDRDFEKVKKEVKILFL